MWYWLCIINHTLAPYPLYQLIKRMLLLSLSSSRCRVLLHQNSAFLRRNLKSFSTNSIWMGDTIEIDRYHNT